jgi:hypothetical protein
MKSLQLEIRMLAAVVLLDWPLVSSAATFTWDGGSAVDSNWSTAA